MSRSRTLYDHALLWVYIVSQSLIVSNIVPLPWSAFLSSLGAFMIALGLIKKPSEATVERLDEAMAELVRKETIAALRLSGAHHGIDASSMANDVGDAAEAAVMDAAAAAPDRKSRAPDGIQLRGDST